MCCPAPLCKRISLPLIPCTSRLKLLRLGLWNIFALLAKDHSVKDKVDGYGRFTQKRLIPSGILRGAPCFSQSRGVLSIFKRQKSAKILQLFSKCFSLMQDSYLKGKKATANTLNFHFYDKTSIITSTTFKLVSWFCHNSYIGE